MVAILHCYFNLICEDSILNQYFCAVLKIYRCHSFQKAVKPSYQPLKDQKHASLILA